LSADAACHENDGGYPEEFDEGASAFVSTCEGFTALHGHKVDESPPEDAEKVVSNELG
jgi:hypothetical protein